MPTLSPPPSYTLSHVLSPDGGSIWRLGEAEFDEARWSLRVAGERVALEPKPLRMLGMLLRRPGEVITRDELLDALWPGTTVVDKAVTNAVAKLRQALGADGACIATVPKVGYRLVAEAAAPATPTDGDEDPHLPMAVVDAAVVNQLASPEAVERQDEVALPSLPVAPAVMAPTPSRASRWRLSAKAALACSLLLSLALGAAWAWQAHETTQAQAVAEAERQLSQNLHWRLVGALAQAGRLDDARRELEAMQARQATHGMPAALHASRGPAGLALLGAAEPREPAQPR